MKSIHLTFIFVLLSALLFTGCEKEKDPIPENKEIKPCECKTDTILIPAPTPAPTPTPTPKPDPVPAPVPDPVPDPPKPNTNLIAQGTHENINVKILRVEGNIKEQKVTIELTVENTKANIEFASRVKKFTDPEGITHNIGAYGIGTENLTGFIPDIQDQITLSTNVPIKCFYVFWKVSPEIKSIKLLNFNYSIGYKNYYIEFRDLPITWK